MYRQPPCVTQATRKAYGEKLSKVVWMQVTSLLISEFSPDFFERAHFLPRNCFAVRSLEHVGKVLDDNT